MSALWLPADLESIKELVCTADLDGLIEIHDAPVPQIARFFGPEAKPQVRNA